MRRLLHFLIVFVAYMSAVVPLDCARASESRDLRIAVVGAGAAGLSAALTLQDLGFKHVTVFEATSQVGGKADSVEFGGRVYDMGAILVMPNFSTILGLANRFGVPYQDPGMKYLVAQSDGELIDIMDFPLRQSGPLSLMSAMAAFNHYPNRDAAAIGSDFAKAPREMNENFEAFSRRHGFEQVGLGIAPVTVGCGYGYAAEVPALYWMQLANSLVPLFQKSMQDARGSGPKTYAAIFTGGYRSLWVAISRHLDVRLNSPVSRVKRYMDESGQQRIAITAGGTTGEFDRIVIAAPLEKALDFLDARPEEKNLFSRIKYYPYNVVLFRGRNLPKPAIMFSNAHTTRATAGRLAGLYNQFAEGDIWTAGQIASPDMTQEQLETTLREDVASLGGEVLEILRRKMWSHFPHVSTKDLDEGFYQRMSALQGINGTFYSGSIMTFDSAEPAALFARDLMLERFR
ncbi:FAD-dependent oxidoreductase [bacterium]|nr:FAD-dependent oxidoreductase [bacterium]